MREYRVGLQFDCKWLVANGMKQATGPKIIFYDV